MFRKSISCAAILLFLSSLAIAEDKVDFNRSVLPILSSHCYPCHGPDAKKRKARLRLDQRESATGKNRSGGRAIAPGDVKASELLKRIAARDDERMPPPDEGRALSAAEVRTLNAWVEQGAEYQSHWAFKRPERPKEPRLKNKAWPRNAIDRFVLSKL
ncbi:MAG: c-type cytochrome domain-containing protein [Planctomycetota bacterium]|nr:c-type cytochrome domain-containing protein [Planctomycetota bacterium]